jgi:hypothetical protein
MNHILHLLTKTDLLKKNLMGYRSIYLNPLNIVWSVFNSTMLMFFNVSLLVFRTASFRANV